MKLNNSSVYVHNTRGNIYNSRLPEYVFHYKYYLSVPPNSSFILFEKKRSTVFAHL